MVQSRSSKHGTEETSTISIIFDASEQPFWLTIVCTCVGSVGLVLIWVLYRKLCALKNKSKVDAKEANDTGESRGIKIKVDEKMSLR